MIGLMTGCGTATCTRDFLLVMHCECAKLLLRFSTVHITLRYTMSLIHL